MAPLAAIATKEMVDAALEIGLAQGVDFERRLFHGLFGTEDQKKAWPPSSRSAPESERVSRLDGSCEAEQEHAPKLAPASRRHKGVRHGTRSIHRASAIWAAGWPPISPRRGMR